MTKFEKYIIVCTLFFAAQVQSQFITVDDSYTVSNLVIDKLINSSCANVDNFSFSGGTFTNNNQSFGYFEKGTSNFPFLNGIVLSSSRANRLPGPNSGTLSQGTNTWLGDSDLEDALGTDNTFNATVIEFDFTPQTPNFSFNYLFASEEYDDLFPCNFSDGFAFLLKKANTTDAYENLAVLPNTTTPVAVTSIHPFIAGTGGCAAENENYFGGYNSGAAAATSAINLNGQTTVLTAKANVIPGVKYHIKLVIADQDDSAYDSAIFIEGGSFNIGVNLGIDKTFATVNPVCGNDSQTLDATLPGNNTYKWFKNDVLIPGETNPIYNATSAGIYKVEVTIGSSSCTTTAKIKLEFADAVNVAPKKIVECDTNADLLFDFNLKKTELELVPNPNLFQFAYYLSQNGAENAVATQLISTPAAYNNVNGNTVWVRVSNTYGCFKVVKIDLVVTATQLPIGYEKQLNKCDDFLDATNNSEDGVAKFDFSTVSNNISTLLPNPTDYQILYFKNQADFNLEIDANGNSLAIQTPTNYRNIGYPNTQTIWIKVTSNINKGCFGFGKIILTVEKMPKANPISVQKACDDDVTDVDVIHAFDTSTLQQILLNGQTDVDVTYFDANNQPLPSPLPNPFVTKSQTIKAVVTNKNGSDPDGKCNASTNIVFQVFEQPVANPVTFAPVCSTNPDKTKTTYAFDTSQVLNTIIGNQIGFEVLFYDENNVLISGGLPNPWEIGSRKIKAVVSNVNNKNCSAETVIEFVVNKSIILAADITDYICEDGSKTITLSAGLLDLNIEDYNFEWKLNSTVIPAANTNELEVFEIGDYECQVTNKITNCFGIRKFKIIISAKAIIKSIIINDLSQNNSIEVIVTGNSDYEYSLDEPDGPFQNSNIFTNVTPGIHVAYVNDKRGCGVASAETSVVGAMLFFTPNGDSYNDVWKISGVTNKYYPKSSIEIFDRYGRLVKQFFGSDNAGWDGNFNGQPLPADDYWYILYLQDSRTAKGHFSLKR
jgi:gliding motility-associated-like protein